MKRFALFLLLTSFSMASLASTARVEVIDKPNWQGELHRYIRWNDDNYSPDSFIGVAKNRGVVAIELIGSGEVALACIASVIGEWPIPAYYEDVEGTQQPIRASDVPKEETCVRAVAPLPEIALPEGYVRIVDGRDGIAVEGETLSTGAALVARLKRQKVRGVAIGELSIRGMLCIGAVSRAARVEVAQITRKGTLERLRISGGDLASSCDY